MKEITVREIYPGVKKFTKDNYFKIGRLPIPIPNELYKELYEKGVIRKSELKIGEYYFGKCRNASVAKWNGEKFIYRRLKFGHWSNDEINHLHDDNGYDVFIPIDKVVPKEYEIVQ